VIPSVKAIIYTLCRHSLPLFLLLLPLLLVKEDDNHIEECDEADDNNSIEDGDENSD